MVVRSDSRKVGRSDGGRAVGRSDGRTVERSDGRSVGRSDGRSVGRNPGDHPDLNLSPPDFKKKVEKISPQKKLEKNGLVGEQGFVPNS